MSTKSAGFWMVVAVLVLLGGYAKAETKTAPKLGSAQQAAVKPSLPDDAKKKREVIEGQVVYVGKRAMSVEFKQSKEGGFEMQLPYGEKMTVEGVKSVSELHYGDRVKVGVEQTYRDMPEGKEPQILKTEVLVVALVSRAAAKPKQPEASEE